MCKNTVVLIIAMLGHLEVDIEVSDTDIETVKSDGCREVSETDRSTNAILAIT